MNRGHGRHIPRAQCVWYPILQEPVAPVVQPRASVAEKWSSTNRIRSQFARIKAAERRRYRLWLLRKTRLYAREPGLSQPKSGHFASESQWISQAKVRTFRKAKVRKHPDHRPGRSSRPP